MDLGLNQRGKKPPKPVTITDPAKVSELRALINSLPLIPPGMFSCPAGFGDDLGMTFRARSGGPALAVATDVLSGCPMVTLTIGGKSQPALAWPGPTSGRPRSCKTRRPSPGKSRSVRVIMRCGVSGQACCKKSP